MREPVIAQLDIPEGFGHFLSEYNGLRLFVGNLGVCGITDPNTLFRRQDPFALPTFSLQDMNCEMEWALKGTELLFVGDYGFDGSVVCLDRVDHRVHCFRGRDLTVKRATWQSFEDWLVNEITRLNKLYSSAGVLLADPSDTLPGALN